MASWLRSLTAPRSADPRDRRRETILYILTLSAVGASLVWLLAGAVSILMLGPYPQFLGDLVLGVEGVLFQGDAYVVARRGFVRPAAYVSIIALLVMQLSSMFLIWQNPLDPTLVFYALAITAAGLTLGRRAAIGFGVCSVLCYLAGALSLFALGATSSEITWVGTVVLISFSLALTLTILVLVVHFYIRSMEGSLDQAEELVRERTRELRSAYANLAQQHGRLDVILRTVAEGLVVTDLLDRIVLANPIFGSIVQCPLAQLAGRDVSEVFADESLGRIIRQAREKPGSTWAANVTQAKSVYQAVASALGGTDDALNGVVTALHDITQEVQAIEARTQFVSTVAHELQTPLTSVRGYADLLAQRLEGRAAEEQRGFVLTILRNVERMATLVHDLLDLCRLESGHAVMEVAPASLPNAIDEVVEAMRPQMGAKGIALAVDLPEGLPFVLADSRRLNQILTNLLCNATTYTLPGGTIAIRARHLAPPQTDPQRYPRLDSGYVEGAVQDTGVGISPEDQERVFERFVRLDNPRIDGAGGTGLGLTIVRQLLAMQGGQVWVESALGQGSTFYFSLPTAE